MARTRKNDQQPEVGPDTLPGGDEQTAAEQGEQQPVGPTVLTAKTPDAAPDPEFTSEPAPQPEA